MSERQRNEGTRSGEDDGDAELNGKWAMNNQSA
jgi:hypothetical protein